MTPRKCEPSVKTQKTDRLKCNIYLVNQDFDDFFLNYCKNFDKHVFYFYGAGVCFFLWHQPDSIEMYLGRKITSLKIHSSINSST